MVRLVPINKFYRVKLMPMVKKVVGFHLRRAGRMNEFDDACADVFLRMIPMLRKYQPMKSDAHSDYDSYLRTCIAYRLFKFMKLQHKGNWSEKEMKTLFNFVSFEALTELGVVWNSIDDPPDLRTEKRLPATWDLTPHRRRLPSRP